MPRGAKRSLTVVLLVVSIMAASVTPALAGTGGGAGNEGCGVGSTPCLPPGACAVRDITDPPVVLIGNGSGKFNIVVSKPSQLLLADCQDGKLGLDFEIPVDADDSPHNG